MSASNYVQSGICEAAAVINKYREQEPQSLGTPCYAQQLIFMLIFKVKSYSNTGYECMSLRILYAKILHRTVDIAEYSRV